MTNIKCFLGIHKRAPVPVMANNTFSLFYCNQCGKVMVQNRNTGFKQWISYKAALDKFNKSK